MTNSQKKKIPKRKSQVDELSKNLFQKDDFPKKRVPTKFPKKNPVSKYPKKIIFSLDFGEGGFRNKLQLISKKIIF